MGDWIKSNYIKLDIKAAASHSQYNLINSKTIKFLNMKDYSTEVKLANTLRLPHLAFKVSAIIFSIFTLVTMLFSIKMLMDVKTYMALFFLCLYLPLCMLSIAFTLFTYQQATSNPSHYNKTKQALLTKLLYLAVGGVLALLTLTVWYSS